MKRLKLFSLIVALMVVGVNLFAQTGIMKLSVSESVGTYTEITGTQIISGLADDGSYTIYCPFPFIFDDIVLPANFPIAVTPNGGINLYGYYTSYSPFNNSLGIGAFQNDLYERDNGTLSYATLGSAPERVLVIQWKNYTHYHYSSYPDQNYNFQIKLYEGTNNAEIVYGAMTNLSTTTYYSGAYASFCGANQYTNYYNILPGNPSTIYRGTNSAMGPALPNTTGQLTAAVAPYLPVGKTYTLKKPFPEFVSMSPADFTIVQAGQVIPLSSVNSPSVRIKRSTGQPLVYATYSITGPSSNPQLVYQATVEGNNNITRIPLDFTGDPFEYKFTHAKGPWAFLDANNQATGEIDLTKTGIKGGMYTVTCTYEVEGLPELTKTYNTNLVVALPWDLTVGGIASPSKKQTRKYPINANVPVRLNVINIGLNPVDSLEATIKIFAGNSLTPLWTKTVPWVDKNDPLQTGEVLPMTFQDFRANVVGDYRVETSCKLLTNFDQDQANDIYPVAGQPYFFNVAYTMDAAATDITLPSNGSQMYIGHPVVPRATYSNNGVDDLSDAKAYITIKDANGNVVYSDDMIVQSIPYSGTNWTNEPFKAAFIPDKVGTYTATTTIIADQAKNGDDDNSNNTKTVTFEVISALSGVYTIGTSQPGARNFLTIADALHALYEKGVTAAVTFEFTDAEYNVGNEFNPFPAIDMTSRIIGVNSTNTILFKPSSSRAVIRGGVKINLKSGIGQGILFGQSSSNLDPAAPINNVVANSLKRIYSNSEGFITFDGGSQKALQFGMTVGTGTKFRAPFVLATGSKNITIKNCLIDGSGANQSMATDIPLVKYDAAAASFIYQPNDNGGNETFSTGVLVRNIAPMDPKSKRNALSLDTIINANNVIERNEISGFGYGIVAIGSGPLFKASQGKFLRYYNTNNKYNNNKIYNIARAGIYLGFEENSEIKQNRIFNILSTEDAYGILAGGEAEPQWFGYNNIGLNIAANEISNINSPVLSAGIKVEQFQVSLQAQSGVKLFPDVAESMVVASNAIWGINATTATAARIGIHMLTDRDVNQPDMTSMMLTPRIPYYFTRNDVVANNTILIPGDGGIAHTGFIAGAAIQSAKDIKFVNNAIANLDNEADASVEVNTCFFYQGYKPTAGSIWSDRNAYWYTNTNSSYVRFIETDWNNNILEPGYSTEFASLQNWQFWTNVDMNSVVYNFLNDLNYVGNNPSNLRVKNSPYPIGSLINNRGEKVNVVTIDVDGNVRGSADQRYDIGAFEFNGRIYTSDLEVVSIFAPGAYKEYDSKSNFKDAEYIMTEAPIEVSSIIRNNGSISQVDRPVTVEIYQEDTLGNFPTTPVLTKTVNTTISSTDDKVVNFGLADSKGNDDFIPKTYGQLLGAGYKPADHFKSMVANVTPRYRIVVKLAADEVNSNNMNKYEKVVRFYLKRSGLSVVLSTENSFVNIGTGNNNPTPLEQDQFAGRLNADSLIKAFADMGWYVTTGEDQHDIDIFDRNGWAPRSVNYPLYRTLIWSDGDDKSLTRYQIIDINRFTAAGNSKTKKNFIVASQEMIRQNATIDNEYGLNLTNNTLRASDAGSRTFVGPTDQIVGLTLARNLTHLIQVTGFNGDKDPNGALVSVVNNGEGLARTAFYYKNPSADPIEKKTMSVATSTINNNVIYFGIDWRHSADPETLLRSAIDFIVLNGGTVVPVELVSFDAKAIAKRVELNWATASEINSSRFDIERASVTPRGIESFVKIDEKAAQGNSSIEHRYNTIDNNVEFGNTYAYRLKMVDANGEFDYSDEKVVTLDKNNSNWLAEITPNPVSNETSVSYGISEAANVDITVYTLDGKAVANLVNTYLAMGSYKVTFNPSNLASGAYVIVMRAGEFSTSRTINVVR